MEERLYIRPLGPVARWADRLMLVPMYLLSIGMYVRWGAWESPQHTHRWNWSKLPLTTVKQFNPNIMLHSSGIPGAVPRTYRFWFIPLFHIPLFGGWRDYIVLQPIDYEGEWYVGWVGTELVGVSRIPSRGPKRVTRGPDDASFFGIGADYRQLQLFQSGRGRIGDGGRHARVPLF